MGTIRQHPGHRPLLRLAAGIILLVLPGGAVSASGGECRTAPALEEEILARHLVRAGGLPPLRPLWRRHEAAAVGSLAALLGEDGNIENGSVVDVGGVIVLVDDGTGVLGDFNDGFELDTVRLGQIYYSQRLDDIDTLALLPHFDHVNGTFHSLVRNDVLGINRPIFDNAPIYGSAGRLQSVLVFSNFSRRPADPQVRIAGDNNTSLGLMAHEFAHRFGAFVRFDLDSRPEVVEASTGLLGRQAAHWCFFHDTRSAFGFPPGNGRGQSVLEGSRWRNNLDGTFTTEGVTDGYSPLDLYLMGLIPSTSVPPITLLENTSTGAQCSTVPVSVPHQAARQTTATPRLVTIEDILAVEGPRVPDLNSSQKAFRQALVLVARQGRFPPPAEIAQLNRLRQEWEPYFIAATGGLASVTTAAALPPGPAAGFAFVRLPDIVQAGRPTPLALVALDADGRVATGYQGTVVVTAPSDPGASLPPDIQFGAADGGYVLTGESVTFSTGGFHSLTATDIANGAVTGTRTTIPVEQPSDNLCAPGPPDTTSGVDRPWGIGRSFSSIGGVRFQYLLNAATLGRPAYVTDLNWQVNAGPDGAQWENLSVRLAHKSDFFMRSQSGEVDLERNLFESTSVTTVLAGRLEQRGMVDTGRLHLRLETPFAYNGIDHLLVEIRYSGGGPQGILTDEVDGDGKMLFIERLGPNQPVPRSAASSVCVGARQASGIAPAISDVSVAAIGNTVASISWRTSPATNGWVRYGLAGSALQQTTPPRRLSLLHAVSLAGLEAGIEYEVIVVAQDVDGQISASERYAFTTTDVQPAISTVFPGSLPLNSVSSPVFITGANFFNGAAVEMLGATEPLTIDPAIHVVALSVVSSSEVIISVSVDAGTSPGPRRIRLTNSDGSEALASNFFGIEPPRTARDVDGSGRVDGFDLVRLARAFGQFTPSPLYDPSVDLDGDGDVDGVDLARLAASFGKPF